MDPQPACIDLEKQQQPLPETSAEAQAVVPPPAPDHQLSENVIVTLCCALVLQMAVQSPARQPPSLLLDWLSLVCFSNVWVLCASSYLKHDFPNLCRFLRKHVSHALGAIALTLLVVNSPLPSGFKVAVWGLHALSLIFVFLFKYFIPSASSFSSFNCLLSQLEQLLST